MSNYIKPDSNLEAFNCPHCNAYAYQVFGDAYHGYNEISFEAGGWVSLIKDGEIGLCTHCEKPSFWLNKKLIYPNTLIIQPHNDMPVALKLDFNEAAEIFAKSPRGAAALLRLVIQNLMLELGEKGKRINDDIKALVEKGLPAKIQKALDYCRVVGNNAVHPGEINVDDTPEVAEALFKMINFIIEEMISKPKEIDELYNFLPESAREAIEKRDK